MLLDLEFSAKGDADSINVLVLGAGGPGAFNFTKAISSMDRVNVVGADANEHHRHFNDIPVYRIPSTESKDYIDELNRLIRTHKIDFLHPHHSSAVEIVATNRDHIMAKMFLPDSRYIVQDKEVQHEVLRKCGIRVARTYKYSTFDDGLDYPLWVRATKGAGGRLSIKCNSKDEVDLWIELCAKQGRAKRSDFIIQEYLPGRDMAWDSLWWRGKLVASYARERLEYLYPQLSMSGITGTPTVARTIIDSSVNETSEKAVLALNPKPHGVVTVDLKEDAEGIPHVTEVDNKWHTTMGLWSHVAEHNMRLPWQYNLARLYVYLGAELGDIPQMKQRDIYPEGVYLMRHIDCGAWTRYGEKTERVS